MNREANLNISQAISRIVTDTYGDNGMARALVAYLEDLVVRDDFDFSRSGVRPNAGLLGHVPWWRDGGTGGEGD